MRGVENVADEIEEVKFQLYLCGPEHDKVMSVGPMGRMPALIHQQIPWKTRTAHRLDAATNLGYVIPFLVKLIGIIK